MMMESHSNVIEDNNKKIFYEKVEEYINSLSKNFRAKCVIKQHIYNDILICLETPKGKSCASLSSTFVYWTRKKFVFVKIAGTNIVACAKLKKSVCVYESLYNVINEAHNVISHCGREKTTYKLNRHYS